MRDEGKQNPKYPIESGYQEIRVQDTRVSGHQEKQKTRISEPDALIS